MNSVNTPNIVVLGGGTGSFMLLGALKQITNSLAAIVNMVDDGGSTGTLRDELAALPPGDVRQCLVALATEPQLRAMFDYRFDDGFLKGHSFGNLFLTAAEKTTGKFDDAIRIASRLLRVKGRVLPATLDNVRLTMEWPEEDTTLYGERTIDANHFQNDPRKAALSLVPDANANPNAVAAIAQADIVVIAPGDLYTSLGPLLVIKGIGQALQQTKASVVYVSNLVTKQGQTDGFTVSDHVDEIERFAGAGVVDYVLYNKQAPDEILAKRYEAEGAYVVRANEAQLKGKSYQAVGGDFLGSIVASSASDTLPVTRSFIRHAPQAVATAIMELYDNARA